jgi:hypothetical protein
MSNETTSSNKTPEMSDQDRQHLTAYFNGLAGRLHAILVEIGEQADGYPGLRSSDNYLTIRGDLEESVQHAEDLADYILHATDENWKQEPPDMADEPVDAQ